MKCWKMFRTDRGGVTVPVAIMLTAVFLAQLVLADTCCMVSGKYFYTQRTELALNSLLASYDSALYSKYGLMGLNVSQYSDYEADFIKYVSPPLMSGSLKLSRFKRTGSELSLKGSMNGPDALEAAIRDNMKFRSVANGAEKLAEYLGIIESASGASGAAGYVAKGYEALSGAEERVNELKTKVQGVYDGDSVCVNGYSKIMLLFLTSGGAVLNKIGSGFKGEYSITLVREATEELKGHLGVYMRLNQEAANLISALQEDAAEIRKYASLAENSLSVVSDEETKNSLKQDIAKLRAAAFRVSNDVIYGQLRENVEHFSEKLAGLNENIMLLAGAEEADTLWEYIEAAEEIDADQFMANYRNALDQSDIKCDFSLAGYYASDDTSLYQYDSRSNVGDKLVLYKKDGYSVPDKVYSTLPSVLAEEESSQAGLEFDFSSLENVWSVFEGLDFGEAVAEGAEAVLNRYLVCDFINSYFGDISGVDAERLKENTGAEAEFIAEKEYVLGGAKDSAANIRTAANKLLLLRFALNLVHCLGSEEKREFAGEVGAAIASAISAGIGGEIYAFLLLSAWSMAEAYLDVGSLQSGEKVLLIKTEETWKTSIAGLTEYLSTGGGGGIESGDGDEESNGKNAGLTYSQYLTLLILMMPRKTLLLRTADVIEINMSDYTGKRYMLSGVFTAVKAKNTYVPQLIGSADILGAGRRLKYEIEIEAGY